MRQHELSDRSIRVGPKHRLSIAFCLHLKLLGRIPDELAELIHRHPVELPRLIRVVAGWKSEEIASLVMKLEQKQKLT
jgi:hypothetical protein